MRFETGFVYLLIIFASISTNARLIPLENRINQPLTIDVLSTNNLYVLPQNDRALQFPSIFTHKNKTVCYPVVGCFNNNDPYDNAAHELPQSPGTINTQFLLFTQEAPTSPQFLFYDGNDESVIGAAINTSRWLRIIVHGFVNNQHSVWIAPLKDELLKLKDNEISDVLVVDWGNGAKFPHYPTAAANTRLVGKQIGLLLEKLNKLRGYSYDRVHCIGHSLGAHTCGIASNTIKNQITRISGLDPAGPFFQGKSSLIRLDQTDAKFVDIIHSSTDNAFGIGLGSSDPSGHVDFYVNGGEHQPGCPIVGSNIGLLTEATLELSSCSHGRSHGYFTESINSDCPYTAYPCDNYESFTLGKCIDCSTSGCAQMGFHSIYSLGRGNMYLTTKASSPFCGYHYMIELVLDQSMKKTQGSIHIAIYSNYELFANISMTEKSNSEIDADTTYRQVFNYKTDIGRIDYAIVYFHKDKNFLGLGGAKSDEIIISKLRLKSMEHATVYSGVCRTAHKVTTHQSETILLDQFDCNN